MKWTKRLAIELIAIVVAAAVVCVLAVLQYRWANEISRTEQARKRADLTASVAGFDQEFAYDFERFCEAFELDPEMPAAMVEDSVARQYTDWIKTAAHPNLLAGLWIWRTNGAYWYLESFDTKSKRFQKAEWPARFSGLLQSLQQRAAGLYSVTYSREASYYSWTFLEDNTPALFRPIFRISPNKAGNDMGVQFLGFLVIELDANYLQKQYLPDLVERHFGTAGQRVFEVAIDAPMHPVYLSDASAAIFSGTPDAKVNLFDLVAEEARRRNHPSVMAIQNQQWQLVVRDPSGSLNDAAGAVRRHNFEISFGLLAVLAASTVLIFSAARRAERLAKMQMEFVAGVSHELCTPLAVINSAADNLADGVIDGPQQVQEYGGMIRDQGRRLEHLVDQVLLTAAGRSREAALELRPVELAAAVKHTLAACEPMLRDANFALETEIQENLPAVMADPTAVGNCLENLISNSVKYAGANHWIAVRVLASPVRFQDEVRVSVEDKGIGIAASDLPHIFEPFYRVQSVRDGQIRGVGLGLYLVKRMMEGMGGRVTVSTELGRGTVFTLHFPVADARKFAHEKALRSQPTRA